MPCRVSKGCCLPLLLFEVHLEDKLSCVSCGAAVKMKGLLLVTLLGVAFADPEVYFREQFEDGSKLPSICVL